MDAPRLPANLSESSLSRESRRSPVARRPKQAKGTDEDATIDESQWEDWRQLRAEMGRRLGGRDATGVSDPEVLDAARRASDLQRRRKRA